MLRLLVLTVLFLSACETAKIRSEFDSNSLSSIVRLHDANTGAFFCSGLVVSPTQIITAAHCVVGRSTQDPDISVQATKNSEIGVKASVVNWNSRADYAIIKGDFRIFKTLEVETNPEDINRQFEDDTLIACGFPMGGKLSCSRVKGPEHCVFQFCAGGFLYPGMSGGPVINLRTGKAIALNTAVMDNGQIVLSPYVNIFDSLDAPLDKSTPSE